MKTYCVKNFSDRSKKKIFFIVAFLIFSIGIFLRVWHFHDWLQFGPDQVRDFIEVQDVAAGKTPWPLLGPTVGGTQFNLGPIYYYFQILSIKIFGVRPEVMAFPDLFFGILTIPLFYLFLKKYFTSNLSLALTGFFSISLFMLENTRFAANPNPSPFFILLLLYSLLEILSSRTERKYLWAVLAGISLGVIIQLHIFFLLVMPAITGIIFLYLLLKKLLSWKVFFIIGFLVIFLNIPQIISEVKTGGKNISGILQNTSGGKFKLTEQKDFLSSVRVITSCQLEYNIFMISSLERQESERCGDIFSPGKDVKKYTLSKSNNIWLSIVIAIGCFLFSIGGYILLGYFWKKEESNEKKEFLSIIFLLNIISLIVFIPTAFHMAMRYYEILFFIPFVLLGLWIEILWEKANGRHWIIVLPLIVILIFLNLFGITKTATPYIEKRANDENNAILGEMEEMTKYIVSQSQPNQTIYLSGDKTCRRRFLSSIEYLLEKSGVSSLKSQALDKNKPLFYLTKKKMGNKWQKETRDGQSATEFKMFHDNISVVVFGSSAKK